MEKALAIDVLYTDDKETIKLEFFDISGERVFVYINPDEVLALSLEYKAQKRFDDLMNLLDKLRTKEEEKNND